jgi:transcriptional regulator with XRE-family HTH domain
MPPIIRFLGYNPLPSAEGCGKRLVQRRTALGLSQKHAAGFLGVDPSTLAKWERGEREPEGHFLTRVKREPPFQLNVNVVDHARSKREQQQKLGATASPDVLESWRLTRGWTASVALTPAQLMSWNSGITAS